MDNSNQGGGGKTLQQEADEVLEAWAATERQIIQTLKKCEETKAQTLPTLAKAQCEERVDGKTLDEATIILIDIKDKNDTFEEDLAEKRKLVADQNEKQDSLLRSRGRVTDSDSGGWWWSLQNPFKSLTNSWCSCCSCSKFTFIAVGLIAVVILLAFVAFLWIIK